MTNVSIHLQNEDYCEFQVIYTFKISIKSLMYTKIKYIQRKIKLKRKTSNFIGHNPIFYHFKK